MTTVRIDSLEPNDPRWRAEIERMLGAQPAHPEGWAATLLEGIAEGLWAQPCAAYLRASLEQDGLAPSAAGADWAGGALLLSRSEPGEPRARPWLAALWVRSDLRGRGLGRKLAQMVEAAARETGSQELVLAVQPEDDTALFTAERWGFSRERLLLSKPV